MSTTAHGLRRATTWGMIGALALAAGCASFDHLTADVATFGQWPAGRSGGSYAFDHLPSQQAQTALIQALESAAAPALAKAGLRPVAVGGTPDLLVQLGTRVSRTERAPWDDPMWWHGAGVGIWRHAPWRGSGFAWGGTLRLDPPRYEREVALLIRERSNGQPLFEARASSEGFSSRSNAWLAPLFAAAMADFPQLQSQPRRVTVPLTAL